MEKAPGGINIARSQTAFDHGINTDHDRLRYHLQAARYRDEVNSVLDFACGKNSHYYFEYERETARKVA